MIRWSLRLSAAVLAAVLVLPCVAVRPTGAATALSCGTPSCGTAAVQDFSFSQGSASWTVVAARHTAQAADVRVCVYRDAAFSQLAACSDVVGSTVVDFVVLDDHHTPTGTAYARTERLTGSGESCTQLDCGAMLLPGSAPVITAWGASQIVKVFNVPVTAGLSYRLAAVETSGNVDFGLAVFHSAGQANYAAGREAAVFLADAEGAGRGEGLYFTAPVTDTVGLVLWSNSPGVSGNYRMEARVADALAPGTAATFPGEAVHDFFAVPPPPQGWAVFGLRPLAGGGTPSDADIRLYTRPDYVTQLTRSSAGPGVVDFIVANYASAPEDTAAILMASLGPLGSYLMDWEYAPPALTEGVGDALNLGGRVGRARRVALTAGNEYQFAFDPTDGTRGDVAIGLYGPRPLVPTFTYGTRADSIAGSDVYAEGPAGGWVADDGVETFLFTPTITGEYLLYLYQKTSSVVDGQARFFRTSLVGVDPLPAGVRFAPPAPSPARSGEVVRFHFELPRAQAARLALYDARGRHIATLHDGMLPAGASERTWNGRRADGRMAPAGLYFARLELGEGARSQRFLWLP